MKKLEETKTKDEVQAWLDYERAGTFSSAIGLARLALKDGKAGLALGYLDNACNAANKLEAKAARRHDEVPHSILRYAFVRAVNDDGTIQIGDADPDEPYAERPVEITTISLNTAYALCGGLIHAIQEAHAKGASL